MKKNSAFLQQANKTERQEPALPALCNRNTFNIGNIIKSLLNGYDTHMLPEETVNNVTIELHVQGITGISELTADFELDIMFRWEFKTLFKNLKY